MQAFLNRTVDKLGLSLLAYFKILKLARTIADLDSSPDLNIYHLSEAVQYRVLDRYNHLFSL
jgi:magnesium chelatase family protein